jgi:double-strand break repair protein MRE11
MEKDPVRGNDSITTFEEILKIAKEHQVDLILLGGDLFHENRPSRKIMYQAMELLRAYCFGVKPCTIEIQSQDTIKVNYQDPHLKVTLPIFSIHGNHDDPSGDGNLGVMDLLSVAGLVNYFGKTKEVDDIVVQPILLRKGASRLALYGLGNIRDERLHRTFLQKRVKMVKPPADPSLSWFNLMMIHQNR